MLTRQLISFIYRQNRFISAFIGDKTKESYAVLTPYLNFSEVLEDHENIRQIQKNLQLRKSRLNLENTLNLYKNFTERANEKALLEVKRELMAKQFKDKSLSADKIDDLKNEARVVREKLKHLKEQSYSLESEFIQSFLNLPNALHRRTPATDSFFLLYRDGVPNLQQSEESKLHLSAEQYISFIDTDRYYLKNEAAYFHLNFTQKCHDYFVDNGYISFANPDFGRSILLEAASIDFGNVYQVLEESLTESNVNLLHLIGGGSFVSYLPFITKLSIYPTILPLKLSASGSKYERAVEHDDVSSKGLYSATQSSKVSLFVASADANQADQEFEDALNLAVNIFKELNIHFRIIYQPAHKLSSAESLRASIEAFSPHLKEYVEVGWLSNYTDFLSKRLLFNYRVQSQYCFPYVIAGEIADITKILACLIENQKDLATVNTSWLKKDKISEFKDLLDIEKC